MKRILLSLLLALCVASVPGKTNASAVLESANSEYFSIASALVSSTPFTFAVWVKATNETADHSLLGVGLSSSVNNFHSLDLNGVAGGDPCRVRSRDSSGTIFNASDGNYAANTWHLCVGVWASSTSRKAYLDGGTATEDTNSSTPAGMNQTILGKIPNSSSSAFLDGKVAHATIWNVALSDAQIDQLASGTNPRNVAAGNIVDYWELLSNANGLNGNNWTANGTISFDGADSPSVNPPAKAVMMGNQPQQID